MERTSWRRRARAFVPALLLLFALAGWMLPAAPGPAAEADAVLETGEGDLAHSSSGTEADRPHL